MSRRKDKNRQPKQLTPPPTPPQPKPWDMPPLPASGDLDDTDTYASVGQSLSQWEHLEAQLGLMFGFLLGTIDDTSPALRAYGAIAAFSTRLDMIRAASAAFFFARKEKPLADELDELLDHAKEFATRRNEIAHGIVQPYYSHRLRVGFALGPSKYATRKNKLSSNIHITIRYLSDTYAYTANELQAFAVHFGDLAHEARRICIQLSELPP
jgi:hypothetical protein